MAKKKSSNKSSANNAEAVSRTSEDAAAHPVTSEGEQMQQQKTVEDMTVEELRTELLAARAELAQRKAHSALSAQPILAAGQLTTPQDVHELHDKLQHLRKEQQEADAARDKAWKQLKAVVEEISTLANPDYLQSLVVRPAATE